MKFNEFGFNKDLLEAVSYLNFEEATPVQEKSIPVIMEGKDLIACAQTGTGKTAAYILPVLNHISKSKKDTIQTLIIVPTRELAVQVEQQVQGFAYFVNINSLAIYGGGGGDDWEQEKRALKEKASIIVATPGRIMSHMKMKYVDFTKINHLILDEADKMLDMGFYDDIMEIISSVSKQRQTLLFSATMPGKIRSLANKIMNKPVHINLNLSKPAEGVLQAAYVTTENKKTELVCKLIRGKDEYKKILIFASTKKKVSDICRELKNNKIVAEKTSSELEQDKREQVMLKFRAEEIKVLVATDVLSRGIDIKDIDLIINYDIPGDAEDYVHRVGRTARANSTGVALTLVTKQDMGKLQRIERLIDFKILKIPGSTVR